MNLFIFRWLTYKISKVELENWDWNRWPAGGGEQQTDWRTSAWTLQKNQDSLKIPQESEIFSLCYWMIDKQPHMLMKSRPLYSTCEQVPMLVTSAHSDLLADTILQLRSISHYPAFSSKSIVLFSSISLSTPCYSEDWRPPSAIDVSWTFKTLLQPPAWRPAV